MKGKKRQETREVKKKKRQREFFKVLHTRVGSWLHPQTLDQADPPPLPTQEVGHEDRRKFVFSSHYCLLFQLLNRKSMFVVLHSDINSLKSGLFHLVVQPYCEKGRSAKVKNGIRSQILRNCHIDRYSGLLNKGSSSAAA